MINYKQGDIILVYFPESDLLSVKKRPAIVLQADGLKTGLDQVIVGMITSNTNRRGHPCRIFVDISSGAREQTGLLSDSVIMTDNLVTVRLSEIYRKIGIFVEKNKLKDALKYTFGI